MGGNSLSVIKNHYGQSEECMEYLEKELWLSVNEINRFYSIFLRIQKINPRYEYLITANALLDYFDLDSNVIHKLIFGWLSSETPLTFSFVEFVVVVCCFLTLREKDFGKFIFVLFDVNHDNLLEFDEVRDLLRLIKQEDKASNGPVLNILAKLKMENWASPTFDGSLSMSKFVALFNKHTALSHPFRQLKCDLRRKCIGESYWNSKERDLIRHLEKEVREMEEEDKEETAATKYNYCDASRFPLMAQDLQKIQSDRSVSGNVALRFKEHPSWQSDKKSPSASAAEAGRERKTFPSVHQKASPCKARQRRSSHTRAYVEAERMSPAVECEHNFFPSLANLSQQASVRTRTGMIARQGSNDDMLDSAGKPHRIPSFRKAGSNRGMLIHEGSSSSLRRGSIDSTRRSRQMSARQMLIQPLGSEDSSTSTALGTKELRALKGPAGRSSSSKIIRRHSSDDLLR